MTRAVSRKDREGEAPDPVACFVCGNEVFCEPSHAGKPVWRTLVCHACGRYVLVETQRPLVVHCCSKVMTPDLGGLW